MINRFLKFPIANQTSKRTSNLFTKNNLKNHFGAHWRNDFGLDDVVRLKNVEDYQVFHIGGQEFTIDPTHLVGDFAAEVVEKTNEDIYSVEFYDKDFVPYHLASPMVIIAQESFYVRLNNSERYLVLNFKDDEIIDLQPSNQNEFQIGQILSALGSTPIKKNILSNFVSELSSELLKVKDPNGNVSMGVLASLIRLKIQRDAFASKKNGEIIQEILSTLYTKRRALNKLKKERISVLKRRSNRRLKGLYTLIGIQMFFTQWGSYVQYSWDIMEPIACLFGITDLILAYTYWIYSNNDFDFKTFEDTYLDDLVAKQLGKEINFKEEMNDINRMISHMKVHEKLNSSSDDLPKLMEGLDTKFHPIE